MNKSELVSEIAKQNNYTKEESNKALDGVLNAITKALGEGKSVNLVGFGSFSSSYIPGKNGRNPRTQESMYIQPYYQVKFKAGQKLKDACNNK